MEIADTYMFLWMQLNNKLDWSNNTEAFYRKEAIEPDRYGYWEFTLTIQYQSSPTEVDVQKKKNAAGVEWGHLSILSSYELR